MMKVTFDSSVWLGRVPAGYPAIKEQSLRGAVSPYLSQVSMSLESLQISVRQKD
jgi:hypothetical protein